MSQDYHSLTIPAYGDGADVPEAFKEFVDSMPAWLGKQTGKFAAISHTHTEYALLAHVHAWSWPDGDKILNKGGIIAEADKSRFLSVKFGGAPVGQHGYLHEDGSGEFESVTAKKMTVTAKPGAVNTFGQTLNALQFRNIILVTSGKDKPTTDVYQGDIAIDSNDHSIYAWEGSGSRWILLLGPGPKSGTVPSVLTGA